MENTATIRKAQGDYINNRTGEIATGKFWEVKCEGLVVRFPASRYSKAALVEHIQGNFGRDTVILEVLA